MRRFESIQLISEPGTNHNEDIAGINAYGAWILDGATGLNGKTLTDSGSDAQWYVQWWHNYISDNLSIEIELTTLIYEGVRKIYKEYIVEVTTPPENKLDYASSSIIVVKWHPEGLEYFSLGDCLLMIEGTEQKLIIVDEKVQSLDQKVFDAMKDIIDREDISAWEAKQRVMPLIKKHRDMRNTDGGYWILGFDKNVILKAKQGLIPYEDLGDGQISVLMASDGFTAISDKYHQFPVEALPKSVETIGVEAIYNEIRRIEAADAQGKKYPRFKMGDDATALYFKMV